MATWWKATLLSGVPSVEPVQIVKSTPTTVFLPGGKQERIECSWHWYAETRAKAVQMMLTAEYAVRKEAEAAVQRCRDRITRIQSLKEAPR